MDKFINTLRSFLRDEEGAQVIEYALIIAVISIILVIGLRGLNGNFAAFITRVATCLTGTGNACV
jgi:pilus assembly protein Flp/PilA